MSEIERYEEPPRRASLSERLAYAEQLAKANLLPSNYRGKPGNVLLAVEYGDMLGVHPLTAISHIHIVEGKPTQSAELMRAKVRDAGHLFRVVESTNEKAVVQIIRGDDPDYPFTSEFTIDDAKRAGLIKGGSGWQKYPKAMCLARASSAGVRMACPEVLMGISYVPEELGMPVDEDGNPVAYIDATVLSDSHEDEADTARRMVDEIMTRSAELTEDQKTALRTWREESGIPTFTSGQLTPTQLQIVLAKLDAIQIAGASAAPVADEPGVTDPPPSPGPSAPPADDGIVDAELVEPDDPAADVSSGASTLPAPARTPTDAETPTPTSSGRRRQGGTGTPQGAYFARHTVAAAAADLDPDRLRQILCLIATEGATDSAEGWGSHDARWLALNRMVDRIVEGAVVVEREGSLSGWAVVSEDVAA